MGRILAVDDDALSRAVMVDALRSQGHEVAAVASGAEALARLRADAYDLVVTDVVMPGMDGLDLARRIAAGHAPVPVLLVSSAGRPLGLAAIPNASFLQKPLDGDRLGKVLDGLLGSARPTPAAGPAWSGVEFLEAVNGPLDRYSPARVLYLAHRVAASGALRVEYAGKSALIGLRGGTVFHVSGVPGLFAGLTPRVPDDLVAGLGMAVSAGHPPDRAIAAAAEGLGVWLASLVDARGGTVRFDPNWSTPTGSFALPEPVPRLLARGLVLGRPDAVVARTWRALEVAGLSVRLPDDSPEGRWGLDATSMRVLRLAPRARTVDALLREAAGADPARRVEVLRALDTLAVLGLLVADGGKLETPPPAREQPKTGDATQEDPRARRLAEAAAAMERAHPVEILELQDRRRVFEEDVANAYRDISRRYHPDIYFNAPPAVRNLAETCFARVNAAYDALRVPGGLSEARRFLEARAQGVAYVSEKEHLTARVAFRRAEVAFRARDYKAADPLFQEAARLDPRAWPHAMYAAWCGWLARRLSTAEALKALEAAVPPEPLRAAEVLVCMGNLLKQDGREADAIVRYRAAAEKDPTNRDAQREIRLYEARNPPGGGGIFGNLLNRRKE